MTKNELMELIEQKNEEIAGLNKEIKKLEKYKQYEETAEETKAILDSFVNAGFSEEQAFTLITTMLANACKQTMR